MRTIDLADVQITIPDGPRHAWKGPAHDPSGQKKDNFGDVLTFKHEPSGAVVQASAHGFGPNAIALGLSDLINQVAAAKEPDARRSFDR